MDRIVRIINRFLALVAVLALPILVADSTFAISSEEIFTKVLINNVPYCYTNALVSNISFMSYTGFNSLMNDGYKQASSTQYGLYIPAINDSYNQITTTYSANGGRLTSCYAVFMGDPTALGTLDGNMKGLFDIYGKSVPSGHTDVLNSFMNGLMQYSIETESASSTDYCYSVYVKESTTAAQPMHLGTACVNEDNYPLTISSGVNFTGGQENTGYTLAGGVKMTGSDRSARVGFDVTVSKDGSKCYDGGRSMKTCSATASLGMDIPEEGRVNIATSSWWNNAPEIYVDIVKRTGEAEGSRNVSYDKKDNGWRDFVTALTGKSYDDFAFSDAEKYDFYLQYLKNNYGRNGSPIGSTTCQANKPGSLVDAVANKYYIYIKGSGWCLANLDSNKVNQQHAMTVFAANNNRTLNEVINTLPQLIELMGTLNYDDDSAFVDVEQSGEEEGSGTVIPESTTEPEKMTCGNSGGAKSLGWIVCPLLEWMGDASEKLYEDSIKPNLEIQPVLFTDQGGGGTRDGWVIFQGIANTVFIVLLLAVIFSQLTGIGIDNYGIKKILPKLIVAAILVNLSYYICLVFVDVSNIVGNSVQSLFNSLGDAMTIDPSFEINGYGVGSTIASVGLLTAAIGGAAWIVWSNPAVILSLLVSALGIIIAIFFLFVLLAARQAAVVVLVVLSPLAFVCYMLPNTKKIFDRWLKIFEGLLLVYPICGLLVSGGNYVSKLLLSSGFAADSFVKALTAMIVGIVPIFFIPTVLKGSFSAMGNLGAKISGFGDRFRGGMDKRLRNTDAYKNAQERGAERRTRIRAGLDKNGKPIENMSGIGRLMRGGKRNMARSRAQYLKNQDARNREDSLNGIGFQAAVLGQQKRAEKDELADYMTYINNETRNGEDEDRLYEMFDDYMAKGDKSGAVAVARIAGRRKDTAAGFLNKKITGYDSKTGKVSDVTKDYDSKMLASVMKEIATGENSGMYRSSTPMGFEFAAQYNREYGKEGAAPEAKYSAWRTQANVDRALSNYVTNSQELVGTKNSSLTELNELMASGAMGKDEITRIRQLANETIENRGRTGVWDTTKAENIYKLAGREAEYKAMVGDATGAVRGENAAAGAESSSLDVRAAVAQQTAEPRPQAAPTQPVEVPVREQQTAGAAGVAMDVRALGDETLLDIATNPNAGNNDATRTAAEQEYLRRNPGFNSEAGATGAGTNNPQPPNIPPQE